MVAATRKCSTELRVSAMLYVSLILLRCAEMGKATSKVEKILVNADQFTFSHQPKPCSDENLVVSIHSALPNAARRTMLRNSWANPRVLERFVTFKVKVIFILGSSHNDTRLQHLADFESEAYGDIVQSSFIDSYKNNTYKALTNLRWISSPGGCPKALAVLKCDDDVLIRMDRLESLQKELLLALHQHGNNFFMGNMWTHSPNRNPESPWFVPREIYPSDTYPPWFQGLAYIFTPSLATQMYQLSFNTIYMHTDDVYVSILADKIRPNITRIKLNKFYVEPYWNEEQYQPWKDSSMIFFHCRTFQIYLFMWEQACAGWEAC